jgi:hypothetical protein
MNLANSIGGFFPQRRLSNVNEAIAVPNSGSVSYPNEVTDGWGGRQEMEARQLSTTGGNHAFRGEIYFSEVDNEVQE